METIHRPVVGEAEYTLTLARALISRPGTWCKGSFSKDNGDSHISAFCAAGALRHLWYLKYGRATFYGTSRAAELLAQAAGLPDFRYVGKWNDAPETTHSSVLWAYDTAIAKAKELGV